MTRSSEIFKEECDKTKDHNVHFLARARVICYLKCRYDTFDGHKDKIIKILDKLDNDISFS